MNKHFILMVFALILIFISCSGDQQTADDFENMKDAELYYNSVEEMPSPIGGLSAIDRQVVYPRKARKAGVQGTVYIKTYINTTGDVTKTVILKGIGSGCDEAAKKAVINTKFSPGRMFGKPVNVQIIVPVTFELL